MDSLLSLKRPFVWIKRFRNRCGYGVHSPFAFDFITNVVYEKTPYYAYYELKQKVEAREVAFKRDSEKTNRLLFRLVNRMQPGVIIDAGDCSLSALYLQHAKKDAGYLSMSSLPDFFPEKTDKADFLYLHKYADVKFVREVLSSFLPRAHSKSLFVIEGIHYSREMKALWRNVLEDERVSLTFDLYDLGILFFDKRKFKQHYVVNF